MPTGQTEEESAVNNVKLAAGFAFALSLTLLTLHVALAVLAP
jgi:hypothetical protein